MKVLTREEFISRTEKPLHVAILGDEIKIRRISTAEYGALAPTYPLESASWAKEDWDAKLIAWREGLTEQERERYDAQARDTVVRVVAAAVVEPRLSVEDVKRLGNEASTVAVEILRFSGLLPPETPPPDAP